MNAAERILLSLDAHECWAGGTRALSRGVGPPGGSFGVYVAPPLEAIVLGGPGQSDFGSIFGDDVSDPAKVAAFKTAMNAYRAVWTPYMAGSLKFINGIGDILAKQATQPQYASIAANLKEQADTYKTQAQAILAKWNMATTLPDDALLGDSDTITKNYQETTSDVARFIAKAATDPNAKGVAWPSSPSLDDQTRVLNGLKSAGVAPSLFDYFKGGVVGTARGVGGLVGDTAKGAVGGVAGAVVPGSLQWLNDHKTGVIIGIVAVVGGIVLIALLPMLTLPAKLAGAASKGVAAIAA